MDEGKSISENPCDVLPFMEPVSEGKWIGLRKGEECLSKESSISGPNVTMVTEMLSVLSFCRAILSFLKNSNE